MHARRIRISFSDPDATESDSGDDAMMSSAAAGNTKPAAAAAAGSKKTEIVILVGNTVLAGENNPAGRGGGSNSKAQQQAATGSSSPAAASGRKRGGGGGVRAEKPKRRFRGVYSRQPGRWAAEFRSHRLKARHWLGTFPTEEEAKAAYDAFEARFLSLPRGVDLPPPAAPSERAAGGRDEIHTPTRASSHNAPDDEEKHIVQALMSSTTTITAMVSSGREGSGSSTQCISSLTTASPSPTSQNAQPRADAPASVDLFLKDEPAEEDLIGLADLADLPLPFLDGELDCLPLGDLSLGDLSPADLSLFDIGFL